MLCLLCLLNLQYEINRLFSYFCKDLSPTEPAHFHKTTNEQKNLNLSTIVAGTACPSHRHSNYIYKILNNICLKVSNYIQDLNLPTIVAGKSKEI